MDLTAPVFPRLRRDAVPDYCAARDGEDEICPFVDLAGHGYCMAEALDGIPRTGEALGKFIEAVDKLDRWMKKNPKDLVDTALHDQLDRRTRELREALTDYARVKSENAANQAGARGPRPGADGGQYVSESGGGGDQANLAGEVRRTDGELPAFPGCQEMYDQLAEVREVVGRMAAIRAEDGSEPLEALEEARATAMRLKEALAGWGDSLAKGTTDAPKRILFDSPVPAPNEVRFEEAFRKQLRQIAAESGLWNETDLGPLRPRDQGGND